MDDYYVFTRTDKENFWAVPVELWKYIEEYENLTPLKSDEVIVWIEGSNFCPIERHGVGDGVLHKCRTRYIFYGGEGYIRYECSPFDQSDCEDPEEGKGIEAYEYGELYVEYDTELYDYLYLSLQNLFKRLSSEFDKLTSRYNKENANV